MKPLRDYLEAARQLDRDTFCTMCPPALVHTALDHQLVDQSKASSATLRTITWAEMSRAAPEAYKAFGIEPRRGSRSVIVGSAPSAQVRIDDVSLARNHAEIELLDDGSFRIRSVDDALHTIVDGEILEPEQWYALACGARVQLGFARFLFFSASGLYDLVRRLFEV